MMRGESQSLMWRLIRMMTIVRRFQAVGVLALVICADLSVTESGYSPSRNTGSGSIVEIEFPDTAAGRRARGLFDLINDRIELTPKEFVRLNCSEEFKSRISEGAWGGAIGQLKSMAGTVELISIEKSEPSAISFTIRSKSNGMSLRIDLDVESKDPNLIRAMAFRPAGQGGGTSGPSPSPARPASVTGSPNLDRIKAFLEEQSRLGRFSGSALIARNGKPLLRETAGMASKRFHVPNRIDTKFNLGSLNKSFTAVAVLQLIEAGKVGIDDPIEKYLGIFPESVGNKVTVRQLLNMSNGWGDYWRHPYFRQHKDELRSVPDYMEFIKTIPLDFEPGTNTQHSNIGFEVAGALVEAVSGIDYFTYIREHVYQPAGMLETDSYDRDSSVENLAVGYTNMHPLNKDTTDFRWENTYLLSARGTPAGGGYSTVEDMLKYDTAVRSGKLIGAKYVDFMSSGYRGKIGDPFIPQRVLRGAGGANGVSTFFARDLRTGYTIIIMTNVDNPVAIDIGNEIIKILELE
jgi:CubicO group peptidase (beta-lactamase class C family)